MQSRSEPLQYRSLPLKRWCGSLWFLSCHLDYSSFWEGNYFASGLCGDCKTSHGSTASRHPEPAKWGNCSWGGRRGGVATFTATPNENAPFRQCVCVLVYCIHFRKEMRFVIQEAIVVYFGFFFRGSSAQNPFVCIDLNV